MKRYVWLLLLISLGLNVGLGWRLVSQSRQAETEQRDGRFGDRSGRPGGMGRDGGGFGGEGRDGFERPAPGDSVAWGRIMDHRIERMARRLDLEPEQVESFRRAIQENRGKFRSRRARIRRLEERLTDLTLATPVNPDSIRTALHELGQFRSSLDSLVTEAMLAELDSLTPEQRKEYLRLMPWSQSGKGHGRGRDRGDRLDPPVEPPLPGE